MSWDPVCGTRVEHNQTQHTLEHDGVLYRFCSASCQDAFQRKTALDHDAQPGEQRGGNWIRYIHVVLMTLALLFLLFAG